MSLTERSECVLEWAHTCARARVLLLQDKGPIILSGFIQVIIVFLLCAQKWHNRELRPLGGL